MQALEVMLHKGKGRKSGVPASATAVLSLVCALHACTPCSARFVNRGVPCDFPDMPLFPEKPVCPPTTLTAADARKMAWRCALDTHRVLCADLALLKQECLLQAELVGQLDVLPRSTSGMIPRANCDCLLCAKVDRWLCLPPLLELAVARRWAELEQGPLRVPTVVIRHLAEFSCFSHPTLHVSS